jgi:hypothetical protein
VVAKAGLDALWATPMAGVELFAATLPFPLHEACVVTGIQFYPASNDFAAMKAMENWLRRVAKTTTCR